MRMSKWVSICSAVAIGSTAWVGNAYSSKWKNACYRLARLLSDHKKSSIETSRLMITPAIDGYSVSLKDSLEHVGFIHRNNLSRFEVRLDIAIEEGWRRKGFAFEALNSVIHSLFRYERIMRIRTTIDSENEASRSLFKKLGFVETRVVGRVSTWQKENPTKRQ